MSITVVAAVARNGVIGRDGDLPWHLPEDLRRFKQMTMGGTLVMGRKTYESIGRPLPGRTTVVVTRQPDWSAEGVEVAGSVTEALDRPGELYVVGGEEIYRQALEVAEALEITEVDAEPAGDAFFPEIPPHFQIVDRDVSDGLTFTRWERTL